MVCLGWRASEAKTTLSFSNWCWHIASNWCGMSCPHFNELIFMSEPLTNGQFDPIEDRLHHCCLQLQFQNWRPLAWPELGHNSCLCFDIIILNRPFWPQIILDSLLHIYAVFPGHIKSNEKDQTARAVLALLIQLELVCSSLIILFM